MAVLVRLKVQETPFLLQTKQMKTKTMMKRTGKEVTQMMKKKETTRKKKMKKRKFGVGG